jgi:UDP-N-acetylmuramoyl-L-alanyl-D-glutamate--2,6-diaminopimelate ligase
MRVGSFAVSGYPRPSRVAPVPLRAVTAISGVRLSAPDVGADAVAVTGVTHDSTAVRPGDLYVALPGSRRHGAEFAADAVRAGGLAILTDPAGVALLTDADRAAANQHITPGVPLLVADDPRAVVGHVASGVYGEPTSRLPVIGITGTAGKTSTTYLIESGLRAAGLTTCLVGTVETRIAGMVVESQHTTPEATDLHALFAAALERGAGAAVIEVSSHALAFGRVDGVRFAVGGWTNFGLDHLDFHIDVNGYLAAKARLFDGRCRAEVLNLDDPAVRRLVRPGRLTFSAAGDPAATWRAIDVGAHDFEQRFTAIGPGGVTVRARVALPGRHNVANALLAIACLVEVGIDPATAAEGVAACHGVPGRLERVDAPGPVLGVVDYAHKPDAIAAALAALRESGAGRLICVVGAGGDRDRGKRQFMGEAAASGADVVIVTDDNPRTEDPAAIRADVRQGAIVSAQATVVEVAGRRQAIAEAVRLAEPGDVVVLMGKGHETGQEVAGVMHPFDDRVELAVALAKRFAGVRA